MLYYEHGVFVPALRVQELQKPNHSRLFPTLSRRRQARMEKSIRGDKRPAKAGLLGGRYWARTSDPQLVELVLSQLS
jgi:hypothetical protein